MRGLAVRVLLFLSLALLPIGLFAVVQTRNITAQNQSSAELSLLAVTERLSAHERLVLQEAFGAAEALGAIVRARRHNIDDCSLFLREYRHSTEIYRSVGFIDHDGYMRCSSSDEIIDMTRNAGVQKVFSSGQRQATSAPSDIPGIPPLTVVNVPVSENADTIGVISVSISRQTLNEAASDTKTVQNAGAPNPLVLLTFNQDGDVLTTRRNGDWAEDELPKNVALAALNGTNSDVFYAENSIGQDRAYAVIPIVPRTVYALSVWPEDTPFLRADVWTRLNSLTPVLMWIASLIVAFWALNRLAITHIRKLGRQMRRFALNRTLPRDLLGPSVPFELVEMETAFVDMAESIMREEATLEDGLREKNILLKEVHHRVKNNLQLISSIMNMQIRQAKTPDSKFVLQRLQERILGLATVHENLYRNNELDRVDAGNLLHEIVNQLLTVGLAPGSNVKVTQEYENVSLDSDDAAPLTLLTTEAITNALKYSANPIGDNPFISIALTYEGEETAKLRIENSIGIPPEVSSTGLGSKLISAFARQLNGALETHGADGTYRLTITFPVPKTRKPVHDY